MQYRHLGRTGVLVSRLCLGSVYFGTHVPEAESIRIVHRALDLALDAESLAAIDAVAG